MIIGYIKQRIMCYEPAVNASFCKNNAKNSIFDTNHSNCDNCKDIAFAEFLRFLK